MLKHNKVSVTEAAKVLGSRGGKKGGPGRARALSPKQHTEIARMGARAKNLKAKKKG